MASKGDIRPGATASVRPTSTGMASDGSHSQTAGGVQRGADLEGQLQNLILTKDLPYDDVVSTSQEQSLQRPQLATTLHREVAGREDPAASGKQLVSQSRSARKRPNQAQRRQMNSQLSIPIDSGPQQVPYESSKPGFGGSGLPLWYGQGHAHLNPQSDAMPRTGNSDVPYGQSQWSIGSGHQPGPLWSPRFRQYGRSNPLQGQQDSTLLTQPSRRGPIGLQDSRRSHLRPDDYTSQASFLDRLCLQVVSSSEIERPEIAEKEAFRQRIEAICRDVITKHENQKFGDVNFPPSSIELRCFGSLSSGFATKASDMDLGLLSPLSTSQPDELGSPIPRLIERAFLDVGLGARLLSRARVPIIKLCESPSESLLRALVTEREKWESGADDDTLDVPNDDGDETETMSQPTKDGDHTDSMKAESSFRAVTRQETPSGGSAETKQFHLKQEHNQSLAAYYVTVKRVLRKTGGRDVTFANIREFSDLDWDILDRVCQAFVQGLHDSELRRRLEKYPSLSFKQFAGKPSRHSLLGVLTQIEGEEALLAWDAWSAKGIVQALQHRDELALLAWQNLQWNRNSGIDPAAYTKSLQQSLNNIKRIPYLQMATLQQGIHEEPAQYHQRARNIQRSLCQGQEFNNSPARQEVITQYVLGIVDDEIRGMVQDALDQLPGQLDLDQVGQRHKISHLSTVLKRLTEHEEFDATGTADIQKYLELLRLPLSKVQMGPRDHKFVIPIPSGSSDLVARVRILVQEHIATPDQPRERYCGLLEFPSTGAGVQCDINFSAHLALQNTILLRCYSLTDPRVKLMVLFVKHWAKVRGINSGYRGTLSSYGYVLMVLHYLVNVAKPFVCPNLQHLALQSPPEPPPAGIERLVQLRGYNIQFWRNESEILRLAASHQLNHNSDTVGHLLCGFFEYFAHTGILSTGQGKGFDWGRDVLSLRTLGGLLTKQEKGWTGAKTVIEAHEPGQVAEGLHGGSRHAQTITTKDNGVKEVRHRYLFAVEDPFETDHNVARTVTHNGIVSIRDEFRRAWRIIRSANTANMGEALLQGVMDRQESINPLSQLFDDIHGPRQSQGLVH